MGIWKDKTRKDWVYRFEFRGENYAGRGFDTRREAAAAREKRREKVKQDSRQTPAVTGFREVSSLYLDFSERKHAAATYKYKSHVYRSFLQHHGDLDISTITPGHIIEYLNTCPSNAVYNAHRKDLSAMFCWGIDKLKLDIKNPAASVDKMPHTAKVKNIPPERDIMQMILAAKPGDELDIIMCCLHTLGRIDEILRLKWADVNFEKKTITLWTRKRRNGAYEADTLPLDDDLLDVLMARWKKRKSETWVFYNEDTGDRFYHRPKMMAAICRRAGIEPIGVTKRKIFRGKKKGQYKETGLYYGFHSLRHFMASYLADQGKTGMKVISGLLRHKNLKTTEIYLHSIDESQRTALAHIGGKFTQKNANPQPEAATMKAKGVTK